MAHRPALPEEIDGLRVPALRDVFRAEARINPHLTETPLLHSHALSELIGADVYVKCEHLQPVGAFKVRGGINLVSAELHEARATPGETARRGFVTASTGNHGQSIAYAARLFGAPAYIYVPENPNPLKAAAMRRLGAHVVEIGRDFDEAREHAATFAQDRGLRYVHPVMEPLLIAGVGTYALEMLRRQPDLDVIIVPVGSGSGASATSIVAKAVNPRIEVIAVQAAAAPTAYNSWRSGQIVEDGETRTIAEGMATRVAYRYPIEILRSLLDDFLLVTDDEMTDAARLLLYQARQVVEEAGAAALAAALQIKERLCGRRVGLVVSGGNVAEDRLREIARVAGSASG